MHMSHGDRFASITLLRLSMSTIRFGQSPVSSYGGELDWLAFPLGVVSFVILLLSSEHGMQMTGGGRLPPKFYYLMLILSF